MTTKHTPGPWAVSDVGEVVVCATGRTLCDVYSSPTTGEEQADVDARLIAAAPDLLAACEMLAEAQRRADTGEREGFGCYVDAVDKARAAIAKAKGET
jgi:hypothetical protein